MRTRHFEKECEGIYRLRIPFDAVYTSVFLVETDEGALLVDCATTAEDVDSIILPALEELGIRPESLRALVLTHHHSDHAGGAARLLSHRSDLEILNFDRRQDISGIRFYPLPGHTRDCLGLLVRRCGILISGDGLQGDGVDKYRTYLEDAAAYRQTLDRIAEDPTIKGILFSHAYEPWCADSAFGREAVLSVIEACKRNEKCKG